jgi:hypothetical protein
MSWWTRDHWRVGPQQSLSQIPDFAHASPEVGMAERGVSGLSRLKKPRSGARFAARGASPGVPCRNGKSPERAEETGWMSALPFRSRSHLVRLNSSEAIGMFVEPFKLSEQHNSGRLWRTGVLARLCRDGRGRPSSIDSPVDIFRSNRCRSNLSPPLTPRCAQTSF